MLSFVVTCCRFPDFCNSAAGVPGKVYCMQCGEHQASRKFCLACGFKLAKVWEDEPPPPPSKVSSLHSIATVESVGRDHFANRPASHISAPPPHLRTCASAPGAARRSPRGSSALRAASPSSRHVCLSAGVIASKSTPPSVEHPSSF